MAVSSEALSYLFLIQMCNLGEFRHAGVTLVLLFELVDFMINFIQRPHLVKREPDYAALFGNGLQNTLPNPPDGIADKLKSSRFIKLLCGLNQTNVTLVNQICQRETLVLVLFRNGNNKPQVGCNKFVLCFFSFGTTFSNLLS